MAKISNLSSYPQVNTLDKDDYLIMTDKENALQTKSVSIEQLQNFFGINTNTAKATISSAQLLTSATTNVDIIPSNLLLSNEVIDIISIMVYIKPGSTVYDFGGNLNVKINGVSFGTISAAKANTATDLVLNITELPGAIAQNSPLVLDGGSANPTQGNGTMQFNILYRVLQVGSSF